MNPHTPVEQAQPATTIDLGAIRARLEGARGQHYWRSLEEIAETKAFREMLHREFPPGATEWWDGLSRRHFLKMAAATLALAGLTACTKQPTREILPYVKEPEGLVLGEPLYYATAMLLGGFATGALVKSREGHPIKVEGNPDHPASQGRSSVWMQASILDLYDPDRSHGVTHSGDLSTWDLFLADLNEVVREQAATQGAGLRFLTETVTSPTLAAQLEDLCRRFPRARWCQYDPVSRDNVREGARLAFGQFVETHYRFDRAAVILALDADFLSTHPQRLLHTRQFIDGRRVSTGRRTMNRLYVAESTPSITGTMADHRLPLPSGEAERLARRLVRALGEPGNQGDGPDETAGESPAEGAVAQFLKCVARDLRQHRGASIVVAGEWQPAAVHALCHWLNHALGNEGKTVFYSESAEARPINQAQSLRDLAQEMQEGRVETLLMLSGNPAYTAPADLEFGPLLARAKRSIHLGSDLDETAALSTWHIPEAHYLESWGDARAFDGTVSIIQPLIAPLYDGKTAYELLGAMVQQQPVRSDYDIVREFWRKQDLWEDFEKGWRRALHDGLVPNTQTQVREMRLTENFERAALAGAGPDDLEAGVPPPASVHVLPPASSDKKAADPFGKAAPRRVRIENVEICFRPDPTVWDGRFANNGWLQECPKPVNKLTWDNAVLMSPALAERSGLLTGDVVEVGFQGRTVRGPVWVMPGQAENTVTLPLGYGRTRVGRVGEGAGFNAGALRTMRAPWFGSGATLASTGAKHLLVSTQTHHNLESPDRQVYRAATLKALGGEPDLIDRSVETPEREQTLYNQEEYPYQGYKWGMSIDLTACIGCNACLVACGVENNIPVVGKDQVHRNREMHWIRIDTYYKGKLDNPEFYHAPVPCMQCEHAPCELVCPVEATVHDHEGLNLQIYNRCVGTRFCSNNCPYKVRRFNFLRYTDYETPNYKPMYNPDVTVRWRGVMEKCTYCVQRIARARITAEKEDRRIADGEILTACQQACPADAIVFGDLNNPNSKVARLKEQPLNYAMLGQLNVRPRTTYLARITNPA